jgi:hypothetical protein
MRRARNLSLMLLALFALGAYAAGAALAEEGVLPSGVTFTGTGKEDITETLTKEKLVCKEVSILEGIFTNDKEGTANVHFSGCTATALKVSVNSLGDAAGVILVKVKFTVCLVNPATLTFGAAVTPVENPFHVEVPATKELLLVAGTVIAELEGAGLKGKEQKAKLEGKEGDQKVALKCEVEGKKFEHTFALASDSAGQNNRASEIIIIVIIKTKETELMDS